MALDGRMSFPADPDDEWDEDLEEASEDTSNVMIDLFGGQAIDVALVGPPRKLSLPVVRPKTRADCANVPRPCPFVSCRHNLYLDVRDDGYLRVNFPDRQPDEMVASCVLDLAIDGPRTLDIIGALMGVSKERARQLERTGLNKVRMHFTSEDVD